MLTLEILNPVARTTGGGFPPAPRLASLSNKSLGIYWNTKKGGEIALKRLVELVQKDFSGVQVKNFTHHYPATSGILDGLISECDAVIASTGD